MSEAEVHSSDEAAVAAMLIEPDDFTPRNNKPYTTKAYWDYRFRREESYDWLAKWGDIRDMVLEEVPPAKFGRVLVLGCGNSDMSEGMSGDGYGHVTSTDISEVVIERMREKTKGCEGLVWEVADMRDLKYEDGAFDAVIDKGAMDALLAEKGGKWDPDPGVLEDMRGICSGISRVLAPGGVYLQLSFGQPPFREHYLNREEYGWSWRWREVKVGFGYIMYIMAKGGKEEGKEEGGEEETQ
jgi:SAM-dependent methyltransferase